jgi:hypothetical protein
LRTSVSSVTGVPRSGLHSSVVLSDGEIPLDKLAEGGVQMEDPDLAIAEELNLDSNLGLASSAHRSRATSCISTVRVPRIQEKTM